MASSAVEIGTATVGRDLVIRFGVPLKATPLTGSIERFLTNYLGTPERPVPFGGRQSEIEALNWWLDTESKTRKAETTSRAVLNGDLDSNNLLITAPAGRGKTALLVRWLDQLKTDREIVFVPISIRYQTNLASTFYNALAARLAEILGEELPQPRSDPTIYYREKTIEYLTRIEREGKPCLLVLDGLDEARGWQVDTTVLPSNPPDSLRIVISARELAGHSGSKQWQETLGWKRPQSGSTSFRVMPLSRNGIADVLEKMGFPLAQFSQDVDIIDELHRLTEEGDPLLLTLYVNDLLSDAEGTKRLKPRDLRHRTPGFEAYFRDWIQDQRKEWEAAGSPVDEALIDALFAVFASAHGPIRLPDIESLVRVVTSQDRYFSSRTLLPLRRFIIGSGDKEGYALAHPRLGDYLRGGYFENGSILGRTETAFVNWMSSLVGQLNEGKKKPEDTPPYALLYYTQHLAKLPTSQALPLFRDLLENGWRRAWAWYEKGGTQGFARDIELAAASFRIANEESRENVRTLIGARMRCALCLSSLRSIGKGIPNELLAELLRHKGLTAAQALHLAQLKADGDRGQAIAAIIEYLPDDLKREAHAAVREIANPTWRAQSLTAIAEHLSEPGRISALQETLRLLSKIESESARTSLRAALRKFVQTDPWVEDQLRQMAASIGADKPPQEFVSPPGQKNRLNHTDWEASWRTERRLSEELESDKISKERLHAIIEELSLLDQTRVTPVIAAFEKNADSEIRTALLDWIERHPTTLFRGDYIEALAKFLVEPELLERALDFSLKKLNFDIPQALRAIVRRWPDPTLSGVVDRIGNLESDYTRFRAYCALDERLPVSEILSLIAADPSRYSTSVADRVRDLTREVDAARINALIQPLFGDEERTPRQAAILEGLIRALFATEPRQALAYLSKISDADILADTIGAVAAQLPDELLKDFFQLAKRISSSEKRGRAIVALLPKAEKLGEPTLVEDVHRASFLVGDVLERQFAQLAVARQSAEPAANQASSVALEFLSVRSTISTSDRFLPIIVGMLAAERLDGGQGAALLNDMSRVAQSATDQDERVVLTGLLSIALEGEARSRQLKAATDLALNTGRDNVDLLAALAMLRPAAEFESAFQLAEDAANKLTNETERTRARDLLATIRTLVAGDIGPNLRNALAKISEESQENFEAMYHAVALILAPKLPAEQLTIFQQAVLAAIESLVPKEEYESRLVASAFIVPYLEGPDLVRAFDIWLAAAEESPRSNVFLSLALMQGIFMKVVAHRPELAGNLVAGSALDRLGGPSGPVETLKAIADVCTWWP